MTLELINAPWMKDAMADLGTTEIPGAQHNSKIVGWWQAIKSKIRDDETPYCAAFVGAKLENAGIRSTRSAAARSYCEYGAKLAFPIYGCIVVYSRPGCSWCGHVGFVAGVDVHGNVMTLGANQSDTVSIAPFRRDRVITFRWPPGVSYPRGVQPLDLPLIAGNEPVSNNEA